MRFSELGEYFEKLEATSSRIELTKILSELLKKVSKEEIEKAAYLLQGRVAPFFEPIEFGMADKMVEQAIAKAYGVEKEEVRKITTDLGDQGLTAEKLDKKGNHHSRLTITDVYNDLYKIATTSGEGSVDKKISILAKLLEDLDKKAAKHLVKITLSKLRLGIGDPTVLDALSLAKEGDKSARPVLEDAYNKTSDLGFVAKTYWSKGLKAVEKTELQVGKPVRPALAERLPNADEVIKRVGNEFAVEPKFDGFRVQVHIQRSGIGNQGSGNKKTVKIFSRNLENMTHMFPDLVEAAEKEVKARTAIFEGEALAFNPVTEEFYPFQETTKRRRKYGIDEAIKRLPLKIFAFDLLYLDEKDITHLPYIERRQKLEKIVSLPAGRQGKDGLPSRDAGAILVAKEKILHSADELLKMFEEQITAGLEGVMIKKLDSPYKAGARGYHWIKFKRSQAGELTDTIDVVLLGIYTGQGKRTGFGVGGLLVGVYDEKKDEFATISRLGTGLTDDEFRKMHTIGTKLKVAHKPARVRSKIEPSYWVEPKVVLEVYADEITRSPIHTAGEEDKIGYALRFPRLVKFRDDKRPEDATTVEEVKKLYTNQFKRK